MKVATTRDRLGLIARCSGECGGITKVDTLIANAGSGVTMELVSLTAAGITIQGPFSAGSVPIQSGHRFPGAGRSRLRSSVPAGPVPEKNHSKTSCCWTFAVADSLRPKFQLHHGRRTSIRASWPTNRDISSLLKWLF